MADRSVVLRFLSDTTGLKKGFAEAGKGAQEAEGVFAKLEGKLSGVSKGAVAQAAGIAGVATSIVGFATAAIHRLGEEQVAAAQTGAAILSTGGAAQVTAVHIGSLAEELSKLSGVDDEVVQAGENLLLTFTNVKNGVGAGNDVFDQATKAALNMSVALGEDMSAAAMQVGKALQDPVAGVTALRRVGVLLTDQQKASIGAFVASGDTMSAQKVILAELNKEFGGSAEAYGKTIPGAIGKAKTAIENWSADVAKKALPAIQSFGSTVGDIAKTIGPPVVAVLKGIGDVIVSVGKFANDHRGYVVAMAVAYTASLVPAIWASVTAFAALAFENVTIVMGLMIGKVVALAESMGTLRLALLSTGIGAAIVLFGGLMSVMANTKKHAEDLAASASKGLDLTSYEGLATQQKNLSGLLATNAADFDKFGSTAHAALTSVGQVLNPWSPNTVAENVQGGKAMQAALDDSIAKMHQYNQNIGAASAATGLNRKEVEALATANKVDLTGALDVTTQKLTDLYAAQVAATKGWTGYGVSVEEAVQIQNDITKAFEDAADPVKVYTTALTAANDATKAHGKSTADQIRETAKANRDSVDARHTAERAALDGEFITGKASKAAHDQRVTNLDAQIKVENDAADATVTSEGKRADAIEKTAAKTGLSMGEYQKAVAANTKSTTEWMRNINLIAGRNNGAGAEVAGMLAQLGPSQAGLVAEVLKSSGPAFDKFVVTMHAAGKTATDETALELAKLPGEVETIAQTSGQKFADTLVHQVALGLKPLSAIVVAAVQGALDAGVAAAAAAVHDKSAGREEGVPGRVAPVDTSKTLSVNGDDIRAGRVPGWKMGPNGYPVLAGAGPAADLRYNTGSGSTDWLRGTHAAEGHFAQVAPAGSWRVWAEPETGGEAYIPLAMSKRAGSMSILAQVAGAFGQAVVPMAAGGAWGVPAYAADRSAAAAGVSQADLSRLLGALEQTARRRPHQIQNVFNEKVDPLHVARKMSWVLG